MLIRKSPGRNSFTLYEVTSHHLCDAYSLLLICVQFQILERTMLGCGFPRSPKNLSLMHDMRFYVPMQRWLKRHRFLRLFKEGWRGDDHCISDHRIP
jgi:hypothetical protein